MLKRVNAMLALMTAVPLLLTFLLAFHTTSATAADAPVQLSPGDVIASMAAKACEQIWAAKDEEGIQAAERGMDGMVEQVRRKESDERSTWNHLKTEFESKRQQESKIRSEWVAARTASPLSPAQEQKLSSKMMDQLMQVGTSSAEWNARAQRSKYLQTLAMATGVVEARNWVKQCASAARDLLNQPGPPAKQAAAPQTALPQALGASIPTAQPDAGEFCMTQEGPFGCTGQFNGTYEESCNTGGKNHGGGTVVFQPDGQVELRFQSVITGMITNAGELVIERLNGQDIERWRGQFKLQAAAQGRKRPVGGGRYEIYLPGRDLGNVSCQGTFQLTGREQPS